MKHAAENRAGLSDVRRFGRRLALCVFALALPGAALSQFSLPAPPPPTPALAFPAQTVYLAGGEAAPSREKRA